MSFFLIHEPFLFGKYSQLNSNNNEKSLCFLHEIEGDILFSNFFEGYGLIFYIKDMDKFRYFENEVDNFTYIFRYYHLMGSNICSSKIYEELDEEAFEFPESNFHSFSLKTEKFFRNKPFFQEIVISNSSIINFIDVDENLIIYSKAYDNMIFRALRKNFDHWEEGSAHKYIGDFTKRVNQQTIGLRIIKKSFRRESAALVVYVT